MNHMSQRFKDDRKDGSQVVINLVGRISHFCNSWSVEWLLRSWLTLAAGNLHLLYSWELFNLIWSFCPDTHSAGCCSFGLPLLLLWIFWIMGLLIWFPGDSFMSEWVNYGWIKNYRWSKSLLAVFGSHWRHKKSNGQCCSFPSCCWQYLNSSLNPFSQNPLDTSSSPHDEFHCVTQIPFSLSLSPLLYSLQFTALYRISMRKIGIWMLLPPPPPSINLLFSHTLPCWENRCLNVEMSLWWHAFNHHAQTISTIFFAREALYTIYK